MYIVSGGQTGVDRAALDAAKRYATYRWGGWCPKGRLDENGRIPDRYFCGETDELGFQSGLVECKSSRPATRTKLNIRDSEATLVLFPKNNRYTPGTKLTIETVRKLKKHLFIADPFGGTDDKYRAVKWIIKIKVNKLNVAGPRESKMPGVQSVAFQFLSDVFHLFNMYEWYGIQAWNPKTQHKQKG